MLRSKENISRTILEFKWEMGMTYSAFIVILVEPYWNLNVSAAATGVIKKTDISRTILEFKLDMQILKVLI